MSKKIQSRRVDEQHAASHEPSRGEAKGALPPAWVETRAALDRRYAFRVRRWYFIPLLVLAIALFAASFVFNDVWLAMIAGVLAVAMSQWNKRARKASTPTGPRR